MTGVELAAIATFASNAAPFIAAGSTVLSGLSAIQSGQQQAAALRYNAAVNEANAFTAERDSNAEAARLQDQNRRRLAAAQNAQGATGVDLASGTPLDLLADQAAEARLDEEILRWRGRSQGQALRQQAALDRAQAKQAISSSYWTAGATLLGGLTKFAGSASSGAGIVTTPASRVGAFGKLAGPV